MISLRIDRRHDGQSDRFFTKLIRESNLEDADLIGYKASEKLY